MARIMYPDGNSQEVKPKNGKDFKLKEVTDIVGEMVEALTVHDDNGKPHWLLINENGKILRLPYNDNATRIFLDTWPETDDIIVGTALLCKKGEFL